MTLTKYLEANKITPLQFARQIGVDQITVYRWSKGHRFPRKHIQKIMKATGGKVTANDFVAETAA